MHRLSFDSKDKKPSSEDISTSLERYRSETMKDYGLMIEYKHLKQHVPSGIYVLPNLDNPRLWHGVIFIRQGIYKTGIFKFNIHLPEDYNGPGTCPKIIFTTKIYHPYVLEKTGELDLKSKFPSWDSDLHYMVSVLSFLKSIFYMNDFPADLQNVANQKALDLFRKDKAKYLIEVENCVLRSLETVYQSEKNSSLRFTHPIPAHDKIKQDLLAQYFKDPGNSTNLAKSPVKNRAVNSNEAKK